MEGQIKCFPDKVMLKEFITTKPLYEMLNALIQEKEDQKLWRVKWQQTHNYQQPNLKTKQNKTKNALSKQVEQEQNHKNGDQMQGYLSIGDWEGERGRKVTENK